MKYLKMLGLAAVAALALMAVVGAGAASAAGTTLCKVAEDPCKAENHYPVGTALKASAGTTTLSSDLGVPVTCASSTVEGKTTTTGGTEEGVTGSITKLTFSNCHIVTENGTTHSCTATATGLPYTAHLVRTGATKGTFTVTNVGATIECATPFIPIKCVVSGSAVELDASSSASLVSTLEAISEPLTSVSGPCTHSTWTGTYTITSPAATHISQS